MEEIFLNLGKKKQTNLKLSNLRAQKAPSRINWRSPVSYTLKNKKIAKAVREKQKYIVKDFNFFIYCFCFLTEFSPSKLADHLFDIKHCAKHPRDIGQSYSPDCGLTAMLSPSNVMTCTTGKNLNLRTNKPENCNCPFLDGLYLWKICETNLKMLVCIETT